MSTLNNCCQKWIEDCSKHIARSTDLERQVAALKVELNHRSAELTGAFHQLSASQAREKLLCELQWKNIRHVVSTLADWAFGSKDDPRWGTAWIAMTTGLSAKDGPQFTLELLPTDDTALQARLKDEREKCAVKCEQHGQTLGSILAAEIRSMT